MKYHLVIKTIFTNWLHKRQAIESKKQNKQTKSIKKRKIKRKKQNSEISLNEKENKNSFLFLLKETVANR